MNCFNNNAPNLSSSDRIRDKKARSIYKTNVMDFQNGGSSRCRNYNGKVGFYRDGTLRNTRSYDRKLSLNRGFALCVDGAYDTSCHDYPNLDTLDANVQRGLVQCKSTNLLTAANVKLTTGKDSILSMFSGASLSSVLACNPMRGFLVMESWKWPFEWIDGDTNGNPKLNWFENPFYFQTLDGSGIIIDPENALFGTDTCPTDITNRALGPNAYLAFTRTTPFIVVKGKLFNPDTGVPFECDALPTESVYDDPLSTATPKAKFPIRLPKRGDVAVGGVMSILDWNRNISQARQIPGIQSLYDVLTVKEVHMIKTLFVSMSWSFEWFTGVGIVDRVCCVDPVEKLFEIYIKPFWGSIWPPTTLPRTKAVNGPDVPIALRSATAKGGPDSIGGPMLQFGGEWTTTVKGLSQDTVAQMLAANVCVWPPKAEEIVLMVAAASPCPAPTGPGICPAFYAGDAPIGLPYGTAPFGGGIAFLPQRAVSELFSAAPQSHDVSNQQLLNNLSPLCTMGWSIDCNLIGGVAGWGSQLQAAQPAAPDSLAGRASLYHLVAYDSTLKENSDFGLDLLKYFVKEPYSVQEAAGAPCVKNVAFGNNTKQNYIVSYDPRSKNVKFNINQKLYSELSI